MSVETMFETASRRKYRFPFHGSINTEDLWDLSVQNLDLVFKALNAQVKQSSEESLLQTKNPASQQLETQIAIVKHIVSVKLAEAETRRLASENAQKRQRIMEIISSKQDEELHSKSIEELSKMLDAL
jgi:hypothetical protein